MHEDIGAQIKALRKALKAKRGGGSVSESLEVQEEQEVGREVINQGSGRL
jgi:hypothetical protein